MLNVICFGLNKREYIGKKQIYNEETDILVKII
jgi:hypothetical protein